MYNIVFPKTFSYQESGQKNPLRWRMVFKQEDGNFEDKSGIIKCRDYFNDIVALLNGKTFSVYGFDNSRIPLNDEGLYVELMGLYDSSILAQSIEKAINPKIVEQLGEENKLRFVIKDVSTGLLLLPRVLFKTTYTISLVTMLIRNANRKQVFNTWEEQFVDFSEPWEEKIKEYVKSKGILPPEKTRDYWYFYNTKYNSSKETRDHHIIHNCGIVNWLNGSSFGEE